MDKAEPKVKLQHRFEYIELDDIECIESKLNYKFKEPLENLDSIFKYVDIRGYLKFKNSTIIEYLNISEFEQKEIILKL